MPSWPRRTSDKEPADPAKATPPPPGKGVAAIPAPLEEPSRPKAPIDVEALLAQLRQAVRAAGIERDDPYMPLITAFAHSVQFLDQRAGASDRIVAQATQRIADALLAARQVADAEAERFRADLKATEADTIRRIGDSIAASADRALARRIRVFDRNTALVAGFVLFLTATACLVGGYLWGGSNAYADIHETEAALQVAFANGPEEAQIWLGLMTRNRISLALGDCGRPGQTWDDGGRKACAVPLWVDIPALTPPPAPTPPPATIEIVPAPAKATAPSASPPGPARTQRSGSLLHGPVRFGE